MSHVEPIEGEGLPSPGKIRKISRRDFLKTAGTVVGGLIASATLYKVIDTFTTSNVNTDLIKVNPFDINKLDTEHQAFVYGNNIQIATDQNVRDIVNSPMPEVKTNIKSPADLPSLEIIPSIDPEKAGSIEVWRTSPEQIWDGYDKRIPVPGNLHFKVENENTPVGLFIPRGINTDTVEIFLTNLWTEEGKTSFTQLYEKFNLGNNRIILLTISPNYRLAAADSIKHITPLDPGEKALGQKIINNTGKKLTISENPILFFTDHYGTDINVSIGFFNGIYGGYSAIPKPISQNTDLLLIKPH